MSSFLRFSCSWHPLEVLHDWHLPSVLFSPSVSIVSHSHYPPSPLSCCGQSDVVQQDVYNLIHMDDREMFRCQLHFSLNPGENNSDAKAESMSHKCNTYFSIIISTSVAPNIFLASENTKVSSCSLCLSWGEHLIQFSFVLCLDSVNNFNNLSLATKMGCTTKRHEFETDVSPQMGSRAVNPQGACCHSTSLQRTPPSWKEASAAAFAASWTTLLDSWYREGSILKKNTKSAQFRSSFRLLCGVYIYLGNLS